MPRIKVASAKAKGRDLQNWVAKKISEVLNIPWGREDESLIEPRQMGQNGVDVILRGEARQRFPYSIECKSTETWNLPATIRQVKANTEKNQNWLIFLKKKEFPKRVICLEADHFFELYEELVQLRAESVQRKSRRTT